MKIFLRSLVVSVFLITPLLVRAQSTNASIQAQAQALLQQIAQLQQQLVANNATNTAHGNTVDSSACPNIGRVLKNGSTGSDVTRLQQFLALDSSVYPEGTVSGHYGTLTQSAVSRWQAKYNVVSAGSPSTTGWGVVGPRTAAAIALLCSKNQTGSSDPGLVVGGVIQVSPIAGSSPLTVTVQATVNTANACSTGTYLLNYGDGTPSQTITVPSGSCQPLVQTFSHTYTAGGIYTLVLAAGTHQTTATVTVSGSSSNGSTIPPDSVRASITSGVAPLSVIFTGTVASLVASGCSGTCSETLNFGDGAIGLIQLPTTPGTWQSYIITHVYQTAGNYTAQLQSVTGSSIGSSTPITVSSTAATVRPSVSTPTPSTPTAPASYSITTLTPNVGGNPLAVTGSFALPSCGAYQVNWGDSSTISTQNAPCTTGGTTASLSHTYTTSGTYSIKLNDGNGVVQASAGVTITN